MLSRLTAVNRTYAVRLVIIEEFFNCNPSNPEENDACNQLLVDVDADPDETWWYWLVLVLLFCVFRLQALRILTKKATKYN